MNPVTNSVLRVFCVGLLSLGGLTFAPVAWAVDPCCAITSINANGRVTAKQLAGKRVFQFQVTDQTILRSLRVGQQVHADFTAMKVSVQPDGADPCCFIVQAAAPKVTPPSVRADKRTPVAGTKPDVAKLPAVKMPDVMAGDPCCAVVANPALKGRLGQLVVAYPQGAIPSQARLYVYGADDKEIARADGNYTTELLPGTYAVEISSVRVKRVTIRSGHDTQVKVGVLRLGVGGTTRVYVYDAAKKLELTRSDGKQEIGFPIGTVQVNIAGQFSAATIQEGKITDF